ncbi:MAG TPA: DUF4340 domain-containing protein [Vicinamibacterales bacterium]|nr:DUF4340 domain-containing protein [Vicinamibacterales bacterium]
MRGGRSLLILLVVALGLGAYIYFVEAKRDPNASTTKRDKVFAVEPGTIEEIEVRSESGQVTRAKKEGADWKIVAPAELPADAAQIGSLVTALESLESERTVDENPSSMAPYGLEPARFSVAFRKSGETTMHKLDVGAKTPTGGDLYARIEGQSKLILIASYLENTFNRATFDLRDKTALKFTRDDADSLKLEATGVPTRTLVRQGNEWKLTSPVEARADFNGADGLVGRLFQLQMKALTADDGTADLKKYGLDEPQAVATVGAGSSQAAIALGGKADDTTVYARDLSRPMIFTVESTLLDDLKRAADDFRMKDVFDFRSFNATGLDVTLNGQAASFAKEKPAPAADAKDASASPIETWKQTRPEAKDVDQTKMNDVLSSLSSLRASSFAAKANTSGDELVITARYGTADKPSTETVTFRKSGDVVHAIVAGQPGAAVIATADFDAAVTKLKDLAGLK